MNKSTKLLAAASVVALGLSTQAAYADSHDEMEKCYGVVKAGKNDCGAPGHSCAGHAAEDNAPNEWVLVPQGLCDKLAGGSTEKPS